MLGRAAYGKSGIRLVKVARTAARDDLTDFTVAIRFEGAYGESYTDGDNRQVLPTDTMKNTVYALAADRRVDDPEPFALALAQHFLDGNPRLTRATIDITAHRWDRLAPGGREDGHTFIRQGPERRVARVAAGRDATVVEAGLEDLLVLKSARSAFAGFRRDDLTTLADTGDRILATSLSARWTYATEPDFGATWRLVRRTLLDAFAAHDSASVQHTLYAMGRAALDRAPAVAAIHLVMPNRHHLPVDLAPFGRENRNEVFVATDAPYGLIEATVRRP